MATNEQEFQKRTGEDPQTSPYVRAGATLVDASFTSDGSTNVVVDFLDRFDDPADVTLSDRSAGERTGWIVVEDRIRLTIEASVVGASGCTYTVEYIVHPDSVLKTGASALVNAVAVTTSGDNLLSAENIEHVYAIRLKETGTATETNTVTILAK